MNDGVTSREFKLDRDINPIGKQVVNCLQNISMLIACKDSQLDGGMLINKVELKRDYCEEQTHAIVLNSSLLITCLYDLKASHEKALHSHGWLRFI